MTQVFGRTDFNRAFSPGATFTHSSQGTMMARTTVLGELVLPSGNIVACDPTYIADHGDLVPFERTVAPGTYPVVMAFVDYSATGTIQGTDATCVQVTFTSETPQTWELATLPDQDTRTLPLGRFFGYGVDSGMGCFVDEETRKQITSDENFGERLHPMDGWWSNIAVDEATGANLIAFISGYGDGAYASYWGIDGDGATACLVTDFAVLVEQMKAEAHFALTEWKQQAFTHDDFGRIGVTVEAIPQDTAGRTMLFRMTGGSPKIIVRDNATEYLSDRVSLRQYGRDTFEYLISFNAPLSNTAVVTVRYNLGVRAL